jgi:Zn finger protein HypA/HybF involved in hydrogenase expression
MDRHEEHKRILRNYVTPKRQNQNVSFDIMEEGTPCDYCGQPIEFLDDDWAICPNCQAEYTNMDYWGGDI